MQIFNITGNEPMVVFKDPAIIISDGDQHRDMTGKIIFKKHILENKDKTEIDPLKRYIVYISIDFYLYYNGIKCFNDHRYKGEILRSFTYELESMTGQIFMHDIEFRDSDSDIRIELDHLNMMIGEIDKVLTYIRENTKQFSYSQYDMDMEQMRNLSI